MKINTYIVLLMTLLSSACSDDISQTVGPLPDEAPMNNIGGQLCSAESIRRDVVISMYEGDGAATERINYRLTKPVQADITLKVAPAMELVDKYNADKNAAVQPFPVANVRLENDGNLLIPKGKKVSETLEIEFSPEGLESEKSYLLPLQIVQPAGGTVVDEGRQFIYCFVSFLKKRTLTEFVPGQIMEIPKLLEQAFTVCYVDVATYKPAVVAAIGLSGMPDTWDRTDHFSLGHIVNLKNATVNYDTNTRRVSLSLGSDLAYVLENQHEYIRPLQVIDRKICLCIMNGGQGVGFCNMNDEQIADFAAQVKEAVTRYGLDGVNLWDEDEKYGVEGAPALDGTSYPKLIKALREALPGKLLTLVDKGKATENFYDSGLCGGIEVGRLLDYAWHGYCSPKETIQLITPSPDGEQPYSKYTRKPIAGLDEKKYGGLNLPAYLNTVTVVDENNIVLWRNKGYQKSDIIVLDDIRCNGYQELENAFKIPIGFIDYFIDNGGWLMEAEWEPSGFMYMPGSYTYMSALLDHAIETPRNNVYLKDW